MKEIQLRSVLFISVVAVILAVSYTACKKEHDGTHPDNVVTVEMNGKQYEINEISTYSKDSRFSFVAIHGSSSDYSWEKISVSRMEKNKDRQFVPIVISSNEPILRFFTTYEHGHAACEEFLPIPSESANNWLQVTEERKDYKEIKGEFSFSCYRQDSCEISVLPDTLHFRNGKFHLFLR